jgi:xylulose-5-phosphate/fructose-6-phosphate phosphoketolase
VGQPESHKSPVLGIKDREEAASIIDTWLRSYKVQPFRADGGMHSRFERLLQLPKEPNPRPISSSSRIAAPDGGEGVENGPPIRGLQRFIVDNCESESGFKVFSPDEGSSNLGSEFIEEFLISPHEGATGHPSSGHLVEILNEDLCLAWLVGWRMAGKHGLMVTYEAFAPILVNQILQIIKFNREWKTSDEPWPFSLTVVVSSLGWRNSSSHHEPFFTDSLAHLVEPGVLEIIFPIDAISTANALHSAQKRASGVSIIVLDKHAKHKNYQYSAIDYLSRRIRKLGNEWTSAKHRSLVVSIGNIAFQQANVASEQFAQMYPDQSVTHFCCENMALIFGSEMESSVEIRDLLAEADKVVWVGNGRARALLNEVRFLAPDTIADSVLGFLDQDRTRSGIDRITTNAVDAAAILKALTS